MEYHHLGRLDFLPPEGLYGRALPERPCAGRDSPPLGRDASRPGGVLLDGAFFGPFRRGADCHSLARPRLRSIRAATPP